MTKITMHIEADTAEDLQAAIRKLANTVVVDTAPVALEPEKPKPAGKKQTEKAPEPDKAPEKQSEPVVPTTPEKAPETVPAKVTLTLVDVRTKLQALSAVSPENKAKVKELISKFGAEKLTDVSPEKYEELMKAAEELG